MTDETTGIRDEDAAAMPRGEDVTPAVAAEAPAPDAGEAPLGFGAALRRAREEAGMAATELAARLHLHPRQLDALEREDFAALPEPIYIRGYLRGCSRELRIDVAPLLADFDRKVQAAGAAAPPPERARATRVVVSSSAASRGAGTKRVAVAIVALVVLLVAVAVVTRLPRGGHGRHGVGTPAVSGANRTSSGRNPSVSGGNPLGAGGNPLGSAPQPSSPAAAVAPASAPTAAAPVAAEPMPMQGDRPAAPLAPPGSASAPISAPAAVPPSANAAAAGAAGAAMASAAAAAAQDASVLTLRTTANVWIDVSDSSGRTLLSQIVPGGSVQTVSGTAPLHLIVGKASAVAAEFRGHAVDLRAHAGNSDVARLTLE
ncbi:putative uncharacterized protein [Burkholderiales bacterium GJ-E10]|nr:putative uncharacterized protein [Burkholderiales bacterium GJ-E10]